MNLHYIVFFFLLTCFAVVGKLHSRIHSRLCSVAASKGARHTGDAKHLNEVSFTTQADSVKPMAGVRLAGSWVLVAAVAAAAAAAAATTTAAAGTVHRAAASVCDIINDAPENTTCVAAHSLVRALYSSYDGPLYQVRAVAVAVRNMIFDAGGLSERFVCAPQVLRTSDNRTLDVSVVEPGGFADSAAQDEHCADAGCVVWRIYDQSPFQNHLDVAPPGGNWPHKDIPVNATRASVLRRACRCT